MLKPEYVAVGAIKSNPKNPRIIKDDAFKRLCASIREDKDYFEARPVLVNKDMVIFAGNQRYRAAVEIGMKEVPVIVMDDPELEAKRMLRDNLSSGDWDMDMLANDFDADFLREVGFSADELGEMGQAEALLDEDKLDEVPDRRGSASQRGYGRRWRKLRLMVLARDPVCMHPDCNEPSTDVDHIVPKALGGTDAMDNLQGLCHAHHSAKTAREDGGFGNTR